MEVILLEKIRGLGEIGDIKTVKNGFARNFLLPKKKVLRATVSNKDLFERQKAALEQIHLEKKLAAETIALQVADINVNIIRQAGEDGRLFGSVIAHDIAKAICSIVPVAVLPEHIIIPDKIKVTGIYALEVELHPDVRVMIQLNVARSQEEADAALKKRAAQSQAAESQAVQSQAVEAAQVGDNA